MKAEREKKVAKLQLTFDEESMQRLKDIAEQQYLPTVAWARSVLLREAERVSPPPKRNL